jgi:DNA-binding NarL/FixJ family response regulator
MVRTVGCGYARGRFMLRQGKQVWRVLVVEDDPQMREFFAGSVSRCAELQLSGSVGSVTEAKAWLDDDANTVDVLLTDLGLPDGSGLEVIHHATQLHPRCEPLVISMFGDEDNVLASIEAGALGYIHKDSAPHDIAQTILEMIAGASPISPMIARKVLSKYASSKAGAPEAVTVQPQPVIKNEVAGLPQPTLLSPREQEVLGLIARGFSYGEIARLQGVTVHTVQTHIKNLYAKLSVHSKNEAVFEASRLGLLPPHA